MKNKTVLIAIGITAVAAIVMVLIMKKQAEEAKAISDSIMKQFRIVDESLKRKADSMSDGIPELIDTIQVTN